MSVRLEVEEENNMYHRQKRLLSEDTIVKIVSLLTTTDMTMAEIAVRMSCSRSTVAIVNQKFEVRNYLAPRRAWKVGGEVTGQKK